MAVVYLRKKTKVLMM